MTRSSLPKLYIVREIYGRCLAASFRPELLADASINHKVTYRHVANTKQLAVALLQSGSSKALTDAAWRQAVKDGAVMPSQPFKYGDPLDVQTVECARQESEQLDFCISQLVNNPKSKFYIHD